MTSQTCYKHPFYLCEFGEGCHSKKPCGCASDYIDKFPKNKVKILENDAYEQGFVCTGIENVLVTLNNSSVEITDENFRKAFLPKFLNGKPLRQEGLSFPYTHLAFHL